MESDFDRQSLDHLMSVLPERDRGILIAVGGILALDQLSPESALSIIRDVRRKASKRSAEIAFELEAASTA